MAFDEAYHYNLVKLHSQTWSPILYSQPSGPAPFGSITRDPSQLYHWILSIPYRLLDSLGVSEFTRIVTLRMLSALMFCVGLLIFRNLLLRTKASASAVQAALLFFIMIPTVPLLSGQINYDNLQVPLLAGALLATYLASISLGSRKPDALMLVRALALSLLGCLNKFTFLPILLGIVLYLAFVGYRSYKHRFGNFWKSFKNSWRQIADWHRPIIIFVMVILSSGFIWFYAVNIAVYRNPVVQCHQVIDPVRCEPFEPWQRNYSLAQQPPSVSPNPIKFGIDWIGGMFYRLFFTINGATGPKRYVNMVAIPLAASAAILSVAGFILTARYFKRIVRGDQALGLLLFVSLIYLMALIGRNYNDYLHLGQMVAINGRYLHPILLPIILMVIAGYQHALYKFPAIKLTILMSSLLLFSVGGGITGFVHYSDPDWYFEGQSFVVALNEFGRRLVAPLFLWRN